MSIRVKICGMTNLADAEAAKAAGGAAEQSAVDQAAYSRELLSFKTQFMIHEVM